MAFSEKLNFNIFFCQYPFKNYPVPTATTAQAASTPYIVASTSAGNNSSLAAKTNRPGIPQTVKLKVNIYLSR